MRKVLLLFAGTAVLLVPAAAVAGYSSLSHSSKPRSARNPARTCKSEHGGAGANAFGKCVSALAMLHAEKRGDDSDEKSEGEESAESHGHAGPNPAMTCKAMRAKDLAHFHAAYGTRPNAFGKCVSGHANSGKR
jgi:hypothetical protein